MLRMNDMVYYNGYLRTNASILSQLRDEMDLLIRQMEEIQDKIDHAKASNSLCWEQIYEGQLSVYILAQQELLATIDEIYGSCRRSLQSLDVQVAMISQKVEHARSGGGGSRRKSLKKLKIKASVDRHYLATGDGLSMVNAIRRNLEPIEAQLAQIALIANWIFRESRYRLIEHDISINVLSSIGE